MKARQEIAWGFSDCDPRFEVTGDYDRAANVRLAVRAARHVVRRVQKAIIRQVESSARHASGPITQPYESQAPTMTDTIAYYDAHADEFAARTLPADLTDVAETFLALVPAGGRILDFGCGAGRDARLFMDRGFDIDAVDGSTQMCRVARERSSVPARQMLFSELSAQEEYDGIWACSSVLHLPKDELRPVLERMTRALRQGGVMYLSFKYGAFEGERNGRHFTDFTKQTFLGFLKTTDCADELGCGKLQNVEMQPAEDEGPLPRFWVSNDVRPGRSDERWLNMLLRRS